MTSEQDEQERAPAVKRPRVTVDLNSRMYETEWPEIDDLVIAQVTEIVELGAYCNLLEYDNRQGMLLKSELCRRRMRSIARHVRVGRQEVLTVLKVNKEKGYIDLSKKRVSPEDVVVAEAKWNKSKAVHSILRQVASKTNTYSVQELYERFAWPMAKKYGHAHTAFKTVIANRDALADEFGFPDDLREVFLEQIEKRLVPRVVTVRAQLNITCFTSEGIDAIRRALKLGLASVEAEKEEFPIKIKLVAPPLYEVSVSTLDSTGAQSKMRDVIGVIEGELGRAGGSLERKEEPTVITQGEA